MLTRREFVCTVLATSICTILRHGSALAQTSESFDVLLQKVLDNPEALDATRREREGFREQYDYHFTKAIAPRNPPSSRAISEDAIKLIIAFEVTDQNRYENKFQQPTWPAGQSGVTIGVGYDLGYVTPEWLKEDWGGILNPGEITILRGACGLRGEHARQALPKFKKITIPWIEAGPQFRKNLLPRYTAETLARLPNSNKLSDDSLGAMVSLVYNRGASFNKSGPRYKEMRAIRQHMVHERFDQVPAAIRDMKRLWENVPNMRGLLQRRELEATLFERGLKS